MLNKSNFAIYALARTDDDAPPALRGILVSPEGTQVTDGACAVIVSAVNPRQGSLIEEIEGVEPADYFTPFVLDSESAKQIVKAIPKRKKDVPELFPIVDATSEDNSRAMVSINDLLRQSIVKATKISGDFPNILRFVPEQHTAQFTVSMDPNMFTALLRATLAFCNTHDIPSVTLSFYGEGKPMRIDAVGMEQNLIAVALPQRSDAGIPA